MSNPNASSVSPYYEEHGVVIYTESEDNESDGISRLDKQQIIQLTRSLLDLIEQDKLPVGEPRSYCIDTEHEDLTVDSQEMKTIIFNFLKAYLG